MNISAWAIKHPIPISLLFVVLLFLGIAGFRGLGINDSPDIDFPMIVVSVGQPGATASELESEVTRKLEDTLSGVSNLDHIRSVITEGSSTTTLEFKIGTPSTEALNDVRDAVSRIRSSLPMDITEPVITHPTAAGVPFLTYSVGSDTRSAAELSRLIDKDITRSLLTVSGVAQVQRAGGLKREIRVELNPSRLHAVGTTVEHVNHQLRVLNLNVPGGTAALGQGEQGIRTLGAVQSVDDLRALPITLPNGTSARLDTLGTVWDTYADVRQAARFDGKPVVAFSVVRAQGASLVQTEEATRKQVEHLQASLPSDVRLSLIQTTADRTRGFYHASIDALLIGSALAVVVIYLFLRSWQATLIAALAIPLSVIPTFAVMKTLGFTLNNISLLGLTLVVGILVDDAIVDLENIHRHIALGKERMAAAFDATKEIGLAVVATTLTIVAVFVPVAYMEGIGGQFFRSFGLTVAASVLFSLLVARTVTPLLAAHMLPTQIEHEREPFYRPLYMRLLGKALDRRWTTLALAGVIFVASLAITPFLKKGFFTQGDMAVATIQVSLPSGSSLKETDRVVSRLTSLVQGRPGVHHVYATIGAPPSNGFQPTVGGVSSATMNVLLVPRAERKFSVEAFVDEIRPELKKVPGARIDVFAAGSMASVKPVNVVLLGEDPQVLERASSQVLNEMRRLPELHDVFSSADELRQELHVKPDGHRTAAYGVSVSEIGRAIRLGTQGEMGTNLAKLNLGDEQVDIVVKLTGAVRTSLSDLRNLTIQTRQGQVPLQLVADVKLGVGPVQLHRLDRQRQVTFTANLNHTDLGRAMAAIQNLPSMRHLPTGVHMDTTGQAKFIAELFSAFGMALVTGVLFIYVVLVLLFGSYFTPVTIMMALPMSFGGAFMGLLVFNSDMGMMALIGIVMLMGLVTKNSILLVDYAIEARKQGASRREALLAAGHDRVRPILMTTVAMVAGMLPIALAIGEGTESLSPMACAVIGGLVTSTLLTLLVVPAAFTLIDDFQQLAARILKWAQGDSIPAAPQASDPSLREAS